MFSTLASFGELPAVGARPVAILNQKQNAYTVLLNSYFQELLGPRTSGSILNVGAGVASDTYQQGNMFAATEYHTLESDASGLKCTYVCSATDMAPVPSERYDWVLSTYVMEHIDDPFAAAREQVRVCRSGGYIYVAVPFAQVMHPHATFGDYWRFTPQGVLQLFKGSAALEFEIWGATPTRPNGFSVLLQKGAQPVSNPRSYWIEFDNEQPFELINVSAQTRFEWPIWELRTNPLDLAIQLNGARDQYALLGDLVVDNAAVCRRFKNDYATRLATLIATGDRSKVDRYRP